MGWVECQDSARKVIPSRKHFSLVLLRPDAVLAEMEGEGISSQREHDGDDSTVRMMNGLTFLFNPRASSPSMLPVIDLIANIRTVLIIWFGGQRGPTPIDVGRTDILFNRSGAARRAGPSLPRSNHSCPRGGIRRRGENL